MKFNGPKVKLSRKLGIALTPKASKYMEKKPYGPGQHGPTKFKRDKMSDYKRQLVEKQRLRAQYNIHERQMRNYYKKAAKKSGSTSENLIQMLEARLDAVVLRGGLSRTIFQARQYVNHGHIMVNGRRVDIPSYSVKIGDVISVQAKSKRNPGIMQAVKSSRPPGYLALSKPDQSIEVLQTPERVDVPVICEMPLVVEFYSR